MTIKEKYAVLLEEIAELLRSKNKEIALQRWQIGELQTKLEAAEKELRETQDALHKAKEGGAA